MEIIRQGAAGFCEITAHHLSHTDGHPYETVPGDHPLPLLLAGIAGRNEVLIDFHSDLVAEDMKSPDWLASPPNPPVLRTNLAAFERPLVHNRRAKNVWGPPGPGKPG